MGATYEKTLPLMAFKVKMPFWCCVMVVGQNCHNSYISMVFGVSCVRVSWCSIPIMGRGRKKKSDKANKERSYLVGFEKVCYHLKVFHVSLSRNNTWCSLWGEWNSSWGVLCFSRGRNNTHFFWHGARSIWWH